MLWLNFQETPQVDQDETPIGLKWETCISFLNTSKGMAFSLLWLKWKQTIGMKENEVGLQFEAKEIDSAKLQVDPARPRSDLWQVNYR